jgi:hypothetical protein
MYIISVVFNHGNRTFIQIAVVVVFSTETEVYSNNRFLLPKENLNSNTWSCILDISKIVRSLSSLTQVIFH